MYVSQIDETFDGILDLLYDEFLEDNDVYNEIISDKNVNLVEYLPKINKFMSSVMENIDISYLRTLVGNQRNFSRIIEIIRRLIAYYYYLSIALHYSGSLESYRNNMVQVSKLQENSPSNIPGFYTTESNFQLVTLFKMVHDLKEILLMTELQQKQIDKMSRSDAFQFIDTYGQNFIDAAILEKIETENGAVVQINSHNLIKTIVFGKIYQAYDRTSVFSIIGEIEDDDVEYIYIDVVVVEEGFMDLSSYIDEFSGYGRKFAKSIFDMESETISDAGDLSIDVKNSKLMSSIILKPVADDFLRYHRDSDKLSTKEVDAKLPGHYKSKTIRDEVKDQQRKKKEDTRAKIIVTDVELISSRYSPITSSNPELVREIERHFNNPFSGRKAITMNHNDELYVADRMEKSNMILTNNEYYLELSSINSRAYFEFEDFKHNGASILLQERADTVVRYSNIEFITDAPTTALDVRTKPDKTVVNQVGLSISLFHDNNHQFKKEDLSDIMETDINYELRDKKIGKISNKNGFDAMFDVIKIFYADTITVVRDGYGVLKVVRDTEKLKKLNPELHDTLIYWIYNIDRDVFARTSYEDIQTDKQENVVKLLNSVLFDKISKLFRNKLYELSRNYSYLDYTDMARVIYQFRLLTGTELSMSDYSGIFASYLKSKKISESLTDKFQIKKMDMPRYVYPDIKTHYTINVDMTNPRNLKLYTPTYGHIHDIIPEKNQVSHDSRCQHESILAEINKLRSEKINEYNKSLTDFISEYVVETLSSERVCKLCGQVLPFDEWMDKGVYDSVSDRYISSQGRAGVDLSDMAEYRKYSQLIDWMKKTVPNIGYITGTNIFSNEKNKEANIFKQLFIKNIIDIIVVHNGVNMSRNLDENKRLEHFSKVFGIDGDIDSVYFFKLDDSIFDLDRGALAMPTEIKNLIMNNILLYILIIYITELNGTQIAMSYHDKFVDIRTYTKHAKPWFKNLNIRKSIDRDETVPILEYPVLCYLLYFIATVVVTNNKWRTSRDLKKGSFDKRGVESVIHSMLDLLNGISIEAGRNANNDVYALVSSKIYSKMGTIFKDESVILALENSHQEKYNKKMHKIAQEKFTGTAVKHSKEGIIYLPTYKKDDAKLTGISSFKISAGISIDDPMQYNYPVTRGITNMTNCPDGKYYNWSAVGKEIFATNCESRVAEQEADGKIDRLDEAYYLELSNCLLGRGGDHQFDKENSNICRFCGKTPDIISSKKSLDELAEKIKDRSTKIVENIHERNRKIEEQKKQTQADREKLIEQLRSVNKTSKSSNIDKLLGLFKEYVGSDINLSTDETPVYLDADAYIIDHMFNGNHRPKPLIIKNLENKIKREERNTFYGKDVIYYTDKTNNTTVYYDAVTLGLIGYKEQHRDYVELEGTGARLVVQDSIRSKIINLGKESTYVDLRENMENIRESHSSSNYQKCNMLNGVVRKNISNIKKAIDNISSYIFLMKNYNENPSESREIDRTLREVISEFARKNKSFNAGDDDSSFSDWALIRSDTTVKRINFADESFDVEIGLFNLDSLMTNDNSGKLLISYLVDQLIDIIESNGNRTTRIDLCKAMIFMITHVYQTYNTSSWSTTTDMKIFKYILASDYFQRKLKYGRSINDSRAEPILEDDGFTDEQLDRIEQNDGIDIDHGFEEDPDADGDPDDNY